VSTRRNELAEALSGLGSSSAPTEVVEPTPEEDIAPPSVADAEELPSYLRESKVAAKSSAPKARPAVQRPRDLRDALLSDEPAESVHEEPTDDAADSVAAGAACWTWLSAK
jgi:hypothetical protein